MEWPTASEKAAFSLKGLCPEDNRPVRRHGGADIFPFRRYSVSIRIQRHHILYEIKISKRNPCLQGSLRKYSGLHAVHRTYAVHGSVSGILPEKLSRPVQSPYIYSRTARLRSLQLKELGYLSGYGLPYTPDTFLWMRGLWLYHRFLTAESHFFRGQYLIRRHVNLCMVASYIIRHLPCIF